MSEQMTQDEIDALIGNVSSVEDDHFDKKYSIRIRNKYRAVNAAKKRYEFALLNLSFGEIKEARRYLHHAAFELWLANRSMTKSEYYELIKKEMKKRKTTFLL
jgi:hypothetical protein